MTELQTLPCPDWSMQKDHSAHQFTSANDGPATCPGYGPPELPGDYNGHTPDDAVPVAERFDVKGRMHVTLMSERELLEETVTRLRQFSDGLEQFNESAQSNPMMKNLLGL